MLVLIGTYLVVYITQRDIQGKNGLFVCLFILHHDQPRGLVVRVSDY